MSPAEPTPDGLSRRLRQTLACLLDARGRADHWLPLLALWTGARLGERGQLLVKDVRQEDGIPDSGVRKIVARAGEEAKLPFPVLPHRLPHACG